MGVPIVLLPLLSSSPTRSPGHINNVTQNAETKKPCCSSNVPARTNTSVAGWGPSTPTRQTETVPVRPSFPFPPRPASYSAPASKSNFNSTSPSSISHPLRMNIQSPNKTGPISSPPSSPTAPYPSSYSNRPSTTPTSPPTSPQYTYSSLHQRNQVQNQSRSPWTLPSSLNHLKPSLPIKPREKPKFEFITLLESGGTNGCWVLNLLRPHYRRR